MFILNIPWVLKLVKLAPFVDYVGCLNVRFLTNMRFSVVKKVCKGHIPVLKVINLDKIFAHGRITST